MRAVERASLLADERPKTLVHGARSAGEIREVAISYGELLVGLVGAHPLASKTIQRRDQSGAIGSRFAVHQKRLRGISDNLEYLPDLLVRHDAVRRKTIIIMRDIERLRHG